MNTQQRITVQAPGISLLLWTNPEYIRKILDMYEI